MFEVGNFTLNSGIETDWKVECDHMTDADWEWAALEIYRRLQKRRLFFTNVSGVPKGGLILADKVREYQTKQVLGPGMIVIGLVVDDVYTTGGSIKKLMQPHDVGYVVFARQRIITPNVFALWENPE
jgi:orotate phosphoribosyltransferase